VLDKEHAIRTSQAPAAEKRRQLQALKQQQEEQKERRYDYLYAQAELEPWIERVRQISQQTKETFVVTNNHHAGKAVANAKMLQLSLGIAATEPGTAALHQLVERARDREATSAAREAIEPRFVPAPTS
jgi:uncharacterized protein YecE (DUF72 family)